MKKIKCLNLKSITHKFLALLALDSCHESSSDCHEKKNADFWLKWKKKKKRKKKESWLLAVYLVFCHGKTEVEACKE